MYVKFCNHINKTLEIIQILVMTGFFGSPCTLKMFFHVNLVNMNKFRNDASIKLEVLCLAHKNLNFKFYFAFLRNIINLKNNYVLSYFNFYIT